MTYNEWIACAVRTAKFRWPWACNEDTRDETADVRFSPRKFHSMIGFKDEIYLLGGRAEMEEDMPLGWEEERGGITRPRVRMREYSILKNDVWKSSDGGSTKFLFFNLRSSLCGPIPNIFDISYAPSI